ncbi:hypothetical protein M427DRAFT_151292 [Gonapodya prolifera JEL478]|uniref:Large ribosomal subunit protein mL53 n=1 Tax=Gonapodya prolifera (strain JEL478) TaxID=1344416 RepID=A0A139AWT8_GONPJ|nr:hypothetical protein M427DRAFT_151292 [Gonapodya prolifera JEL478]|eukprot:KXS21167.1 hypothetical protein M427DRAFT_151292 [Gonapodya prolifera JEL478]
MDLRQVSRIMVEFAPRDVHARSLRTFLLHVSDDGKRESNPNCRIQTTIADRVATPGLQVTYKDGKSLNMVTSSMTAEEILREFRRHARALQEDEDAKSA